MLSCERIQLKTILLTVREGFMSERRPSASTRKQKSRKSVLFVSNEYGSDLRSNEHYISSSEIEPEKIQACTGFEPMTSAIPRSALPTELTSHHVGSK